MSDSKISNFWNYKDMQFRFDMILSNDFSNLRNVTQVYACVLSKDKKYILLAYNKMGLWLLPGGKVEEGETLLETLVREVKEETNRDLDMNSVKPFFYQESYKKNDKDEWEFRGVEVRYSGVVKNDLEFVSDPDNGDIVKTEWVPIEDLGNYLDWGKTIPFIKENLPKQ